MSKNPVKKKIKLEIGVEYIGTEDVFFIQSMNPFSKDTAYTRLLRFDSQHFKELEEAKKEMAEFIKQHSKDYEAA